MNRGMKLAAAIAACCAIALSVAACGGGDDSSGGGGSTSAGDVCGTVTIWDIEYGSLPEYSKGVDKIDAEFERLHPEVKINRVAQAPEGYEAVYRAAFTAREGPDIMVMQPGAAGILTFTPGLEPLDDYV